MAINQLLSSHSLLRLITEEGTAVLYWPCQLQHTRVIHALDVCCWRHRLSYISSLIWSEICAGNIKIIMRKDPENVCVGLREYVRVQNVRIYVRTASKLQLNSLLPILTAVTFIVVECKLHVCVLRSIQSWRPQVKKKHTAVKKTGKIENWKIG